MMKLMNIFSTHQRKKWSRIYVENAEERHAQTEVKRAASVPQGFGISQIVAGSIITNRLAKRVRGKLKTRHMSCHVTLQNLKPPQIQR